MSKIKTKQKHHRKYFNPTGIVHYIMKTNGAS